MFSSCVHCGFVLLLCGFVSGETEILDVTVITSAKQDTEVYQRFLRSANMYKLDVKVIEQEEGFQCHASDDDHCTSKDIGESMLLSLRKLLQDITENQDQIVIVTNSPFLVFNAGKEVIMESFRRSEAKVLFSAATNCNSEESLKLKYPKITKGKACLNSAGYIGYASALYNILNEHLLKHSGDDQLFFTKVYLDKKLREDYHIKIDHTSELFQTLDQEGEFDIKYQDDDAYLKNLHTNSTPSIILGSEHNPSLIDIVGDYLARSYNPHKGCLQCRENNINLNRVDNAKKPIVLIGLFISKPTLFFEEFLADLTELNYPKNKVHLFVHLGHKYNQKDIEDYLKNHEKSYLSVTYDGVREQVKEWQAKTEAVKLCLEKKCDYYFNVDTSAHLFNRQVLVNLIEQNRSVVAPFLFRISGNNRIPNIWRFMDQNGKEQNTLDNTLIAEFKQRGLWTVACISSAYLINGTLLRSIRNYRDIYNSELTPDLSFCQYMKKSNVLLYASNRDLFGYLVSIHSFNTRVTHSEMYDAENNTLAWHQRYMSKDYELYTKNIKQPEEPCPGVYHFPLLSPQFCTELLEIVEHHEANSNNKIEDSNNPGNADAKFTDDVYLDDLGLTKEWYFASFGSVLITLSNTIFPLYRDMPEVVFSFVSRFNGDGLSKIETIKDSFNYTVNVALNKRGVDFQGGGIRFIKDDCTVTDFRVGWALMHSYNLLHESVKTTKGTRHTLLSVVHVANAQ